MKKSQLDEVIKKMVSKELLKEEPLSGSGRANQVNKIESKIRVALIEMTDRYFGFKINDPGKIKNFATEASQDVMAILSENDIL